MRVCVTVCTHFDENPAKTCRICDRLKQTLVRMQGENGTMSVSDLITVKVATKQDISTLMRTAEKHKTVKGTGLSLTHSYTLSCTPPPQNKRLSPRLFCFLHTRMRMRLESHTTDFVFAAFRR